MRARLQDVMCDIIERVYWDALAPVTIFTEKYYGETLNFWGIERAVL
jgi:hypothetical protein